MPTFAQIEANRRNAQLSTGPRTVQGKAVSRYNRLQHGLRAATEPLPDEDPADYEALASALIDQLHPVGALEVELVGRIVTQTWRLRRIACIESGILLWHLHRERLDGADQDVDRLGIEMARIGGNAPRYGGLKAHANALEEGAPALGRAFSRDADGPDALSKLSRYEMRLSRSLTRDLLLLERLQQRRQG